MPNVSAQWAISRAVVAGVMRSTMEFGKATFAAIQSAKAGSLQPCETGDGVLGDVAVAGDVVAGHHRERHEAGRAAALQARHDEAEHGIRIVGIGAVGGDRRMGRVETRGRRSMK